MNLEIARTRTIKIYTRIKKLEEQKDVNGLANELINPNKKIRIEAEKALTRIAKPSFVGDDTWRRWLAEWKMEIISHKTGAEGNGFEYGYDT